MAALKSNYMDEYLEANLKRWNELAPIHARSAFYDVDGFKSGKSSLTPVELEELGDVSGKSLLHLQCHFGLDSISWARLGAKVTGVDFSDEAIALARSLSDELSAEASFVVSNVYDLPSVLEAPEEFDIVFTSYGVLCWLPDLTGWGQVIARFLKPGGVFYIAEFHPFANIFYDEDDATDLKVYYPYFHTVEPVEFNPSGSYADKNAVGTTRTYEWHHSIGDIINALTSAGLRIEFLHEFPYCVYQHLPMMEKGDDGWWRLKDRSESVPIMFSLKAVKR